MSHDEYALFTLEREGDETRGSSEQAPELHLPWLAILSRDFISAGTGHQGAATVIKVPLHSSAFHQNHVHKVLLL
jgi:hypothetical protein